MDPCTALVVCVRATYDSVNEVGFGFPGAVDGAADVPCLGDGVGDGVLLDDGAGERGCCDGDFEAEVDAL